MINVAVAGYMGKMGSTISNAIANADDMAIVAGIDPNAQPDIFPTFQSIEKAIDNVHFDVLVDFTYAQASKHNLACALAKGIDCVVGTTGLTNDDLEKLIANAKPNTTLFYAPNFTTGAVLMMEFSKIAAPYFPEAEIIEFHHANKKDAPSGTSIRTAEIIESSRKNCDHTFNETSRNQARGALYDNVPIHSVRNDGYVASQEVIFGSFGQTLAIRHDSWDRQSYMPGVLLGIRSVGNQKGLIIGLEQLMNLKN